MKSPQAALLQEEDFIRFQMFLNHSSYPAPYIASVYASMWKKCLSVSGNGNGMTLEAFSKCVSQFDLKSGMTINFWGRYCYRLQCMYACMYVCMNLRVSLLQVPLRSRYSIHVTLLLLQTKEFHNPILEMMTFLDGSYDHNKIIWFLNFLLFFV